jgi:hypothetical protein
MGGVGLREDVCQRNSVQYVNLNTPPDLLFAAVSVLKYVLNMALIAEIWLDMVSMWI